MQVQVEVTDEIVKTQGGNSMQVCYVGLGGKYPERVTRFLGKDAPLPAGAYVATQGRIDNYRPVIDVQSLTRASK
jgi:hypothetical protein